MYCIMPSCSGHQANSCVFQGEVGPPGFPGTPGKEGLMGPKVCALHLFMCVYGVQMHSLTCLFLCERRATVVLTGSWDLKEVREKKVKG